VGGERGEGEGYAGREGEGGSKESRGKRDYERGRRRGRKVNWREVSWREVS
jgi:hypothetical protein